MSWCMYVGCALLLVAVGILLIPGKTGATRSISFDAGIRDVWEVYTSPQGQAEWRDDVDEVKMAEDGRSWTETQGGITVHLRILEEVPPERYVLQTGSPGRFEGTYTAEFREEEGRTVGTFTEEATTLGVVPKVFRFLFFNPGRFIENYAESARAEIARRQREKGSP